MRKLIVLLILLWQGIGCVEAKEKTCLTSATEVVIVTPAQTNLSVNLAALELQLWLQKTMDLEAEIRHTVGNGFPIYVGASVACNELIDGLSGQEYVVDVNDQRIILCGSDVGSIDGAETINYSKANGLAGDAVKVTLPGMHENVTTCYAVYDFIEQYLGVRFYGPDPRNVVYDKVEQISLKEVSIKTKPTMKYRVGTIYNWPIEKEQHFSPSNDMSQLYMRRLRVGGLKFNTNHALTSFQDRFLNKDSEIFESYHPEFFAEGQKGGADRRQLCYSNRKLIEQVAQDAIDYFQKGILKGKAIASGDYFNITPMDNNYWCKCDECQKLINKDKGNIEKGHFNSGIATNYIWNFVNEVAKIVKKECPDKYIVGLSYHDYAYLPSDVQLEDNVVVDLCTHARHWGWSKEVRKVEQGFYNDWVDYANKNNSDVFMWNYYCFPMERGVIQKFGVFPGFSANLLGDIIHQYTKDGIDGVFLCGIGEQLDYYLTMKMYFDGNLNYHQLISEFFDRYFGPASKPMLEFYSLIEKRYNDPNSYPISALKGHKHMTEEIAWDYLGTDEVMQQLEKLMSEATKLVSDGVYAERVESWNEGVLDYMKKGKQNYEAKK
ncbi:DUF4838 domain-containing protein [Puteibacter caeruleilacunae]|nr:DUF4838 domain-containing protein [Puteibacter caeruleilacunae]